LVSTLLEPHRAWLLERAPAVRFSARILWQELCRDRGFEGSYEIGKLADCPLRSAANAASVTH